MTVLANTYRSKCHKDNSLGSCVTFRALLPLSHPLFVVSHHLIAHQAPSLTNRSYTSHKKLPSLRPHIALLSAGTSSKLELNDNMNTTCPRCRDEATKSCDACRQIKYCSPECLQADAHAHKLVCRSFKDMPSTDPGAGRSCIRADGYLCLWKRGAACCIDMQHLNRSSIRPAFP